MMDRNDYRHFVCIVAGEEPDELMKPYDKNIKVPQYIVYKKSDASKIRASYIKMYEGILENSDASNKYGKEKLEAVISDLKEMDDEDFFDEISFDYDIDDEGNAVSTSNKEGKYSFYKLGKAFSVPFLTNDGREVFQAMKGDIDWGSIHQNGTEVYKRVWEMVMEGSEPKNDEEKVVYNNMKDKESYFKKFETKENYVASNTSFWGYAFLSDKTGWIECEPGEEQFTWMKNFYDVFIKNLSDSTKLTIYECIK